MFMLSSSQSQSPSLPRTCSSSSSSSSSIRNRRRPPFTKVVVMMLLLFFFLTSSPSSSLWVTAESSSTSSSNNNNNPFHILGVHRNASQGEIQKQYRKLCLQYHPDKNVQKSSKERARCETQFKTVQRAYEQIGTDTARRDYELREQQQQYYGRFGSTSSSGSTSSGSTASRQHSDPFADALFRAFQQGRGTSFYFRSAGTAGGGMPRFGGSGNGSFRRSPFSSYPSAAASNTAAAAGIPPNLFSFKSIYKQTVMVPLDVMYTGQSNFELELIDNLWTRLRAAVRGKCAYLSIYQGMLYALPTMRASKYLALMVGSLVLYATMPAPEEKRRSDNIENNNDDNDNDGDDASNNGIFRIFSNKSNKGNNPININTKYIYRHDIRRGCKRDIITFRSTGYDIPEVVFELKEAPHPIYERRDNDLHASITITETEQRRGCTKRLPNLDPNNNNNGDPIEVIVKPKNNNNSNNDKDDDNNTTIRLTGRGWPVKNAPGVYLHGDLIVHVKVVPDKQKKKKRRRQYNKTKRRRNPNNKN